METKFTFSEETAVATAICLRILELLKTIDECVVLGHDCAILYLVVDDLKSAFKKVTGVEFDSVHHD